MMEAVRILRGWDQGKAEDDEDGHDPMIRARHNEDAVEDYDADAMNRTSRSPTRNNYRGNPFEERTEIGSDEDRTDNNIVLESEKGDAERNVDNACISDM